MADRLPMTEGAVTLTEPGNVSTHVFVQDVELVVDVSSLLQRIRAALRAFIERRLRTTVAGVVDAADARAVAGAVNPRDSGGLGCI